VGNLARINFKPFSVTDSTTLAVQNTKQSLQLLDASGGTYTLTFRFGGHTGTTGPLPSTAPANDSTKPTGVGVAALGGGSLTAGTYFYVVTALTSGGESVGSAEVSTAVAASGTAALAWTAVAGATGYRVYRGTAAGAENKFFTTATANYTDLVGRRRLDRGGAGDQRPGRPRDGHQQRTRIGGQRERDRLGRPVRDRVRRAAARRQACRHADR